MIYKNYFGVAMPTSGTPAHWATVAPPVGSTSTGTAQNDQLVDVAGGATLVGLGGDDTYLIADSTTKIVEAAGGGIDSVVTWVPYQLPANVENLTLEHDLLTGIANDTGSMIIADGSHDNLVSGKGSDVLVDNTTNEQNIFVFNPASGKDVIYGFDATSANHDLIRIDDPQFTTFDSVKAAMTQVGSDVQIKFDANDVVLVKDVNIADFSSNDFLLPFTPDNLKMTFDDEFNSLSLYNAATGQGTWKTSYTYGPSDGVGSINSRTFTGESEIYVDPTYAGDPSKSTKALGLNPFAINNGVLSITASKLTAAQSADLYNEPYASGLLTTEKTFSQTYGYFDMRAELPMQKGMFPAFWLLPTSKTWPPEIDIMENVSQNYTSSGAISDAEKTAFYTYFPNGLSGMHDYGLLWTASTITWYVDGQAIGSIDTPADMHQAMYMVVNLAVGTSWAGLPDANFTSASMNIDYIRAYSLDQVGASTGDSGSTGGDTSSPPATGGDTPPPVTSGDTPPPVTGSGDTHVVLQATANNQTLQGTSGADTFKFDASAPVASTTVADFGKSDIVVTAKALADNNNDGIITFSNNLLHLGGAGIGPTVDFQNINPKDGLRVLGQMGPNEFVYADATTRPTGAIEGKLGNDQLTGDVGDKKTSIFFADTALDINLGQDKLVNFGAKDILVTTSALTLGSDGHLDAGATGLFGLPGEDGSLAIQGLVNDTVASMQFDGSSTHGGATYYVYSLSGSTAGLEQLPA
jgi:beta-glucanase (GH16 family)